MQGTNRDIADAKGIGVYLLQVFLKVLAFFPGLILSLIQVIKQKWTGGWFWSLAYWSDVWGNHFFAPHANVKWILPTGYQFGQGADPISKVYAINIKDKTYLPAMLKWVRKVEKADPGHMAHTLKSHKIPFDEIEFAQTMAIIMQPKKELNLLQNRINAMKQTPTFFKMLMTDKVHAIFLTIVTIATIAFGFAIPFYFFDEPASAGAEISLPTSVTLCMAIFVSATILLWYEAIKKYKATKK